MKKHLLPALFSAAVLSSAAFAAESVSWKALGWDVPIIGQLGVPLGQAVEIEAQVTSIGALFRNSLYDMYYCLEVRKVGGKPLAKVRHVNFKAYPGDYYPVPMPSYRGENVKGKTPPPGERTPEQLLAEERAYFATTFRLLVFETGQFDGLPPSGVPGFSFVERMPEPAREPGEPEPRFSTQVRILRVLDPSDGLPNIPDPEWIAP